MLALHNSFVIRYDQHMPSLPKPCKWGHTEGWYASGHCKTCAKEHQRKWEATNRERRAEQKRLRFLAAPEKVRASWRASASRWKKANPEKAAAATQRWRDANPEKYAATVRKHHRANYLKTKHGLTVAEYDALVTAQDGLCIICGNPPASGRLSVDHCHSTKVRRGLLCDPCNMGLGLFGNNPDRLRAAAMYLERANGLKLHAA